MNKKDKKKLEKKLTIGFQVFALIGLIIIGFYLGKAYKARRNAVNKEESIKDFGKKFDEFNIDSNTSKYSAKLDDKKIDIENKSDGVYINDKKINFSYVMGGYVMDKSILIYNVGQNGYLISFINKDGEMIPFDNKGVFEHLELVDGKIKAFVYNYNEGMNCKLIHNLNICPCNELESGELLKKYKEELDTYKDEILQGVVLLSYNGKEINMEYTEKQTIMDLYGSDLEGTTQNYCVSNN